MQHELKNDFSIGKMDLGHLLLYFNKMRIARNLSKKEILEYLQLLNLHTKNKPTSPSIHKWDLT